MAPSERKAPPPPDPENGIWQGRSVARRFVSPDGMTVLVGRTAEDNDVLTFKLGSPPRAPSPYSFTISSSVMSNTSTPRGLPAAPS